VNKVMIPWSDGTEFSHNTRND